jgi:WD40 repeat protein
MKFSVDGRYLAVAGQDAVIRVYKVLDTPEARKQEVTDLVARAEAQLNGNLFPASGGTEGASSTSLPGKAGNGNASAPSSVRSKGAVETPLPSVPVFASEPVREFVGHTNDCLDLSWSKNGFLLSASMDKTARLWHLSSPTCLVSFVHGDFVTSACFHPRDDRFFLSGSLDGKLRLWNIPAKRVQCSQEVPGLITACAFTRTGGTACVGTFAGAALFYSTDGLVYQSSIAVRSPTGKNAKGGRKITGIEPLIDDSAAGERVLITSNDSRIRAYNLRDKALSGRFKASKTYTNRTSQIRASVSEDGMYVIAGSEAGSEGGFVHLWDVGQLAGDANGTPSSIKASGDSCCEYFSAASGTITCAVMAPLKTHSYLRTSEDPILLHAEMRNAGRVSSHTTSALSSMSLASALSAALPGTLAPGSSGQPQPGFDARSCRILASVDESAVVRIWRQDSYGALPA